MTEKYRKETYIVPDQYNYGAEGLTVNINEVNGPFYLSQERLDQWRAENTLPPVTQEIVNFVNSLKE